MIQDNSLTFAQAQLIPQTQTTTEATNVIDTVVVNGGIQGATGNVGNGDAEPLNLNLVISTDQLAASATSAATLQFILYSGATDTATNTLYTSPAYTVAQLNQLVPDATHPSGMIIVPIVIPRGLMLEFLGLNLVTAGGENFSAGHVTAFLALEAVQTNFNQ